MALSTIVVVSSHSSYTASADPTDPYIIITRHPAPVSISNTATFEFLSYNDPTECQIDGSTYEPCDSPYTTPALDEGSHTFTVHVIDSTAPEGLSTYSWTTYTTPSFMGGSAVSGHANTSIAVSDLQIDGATDDDLTIKLVVQNGSLQLGTTTGITFTGNHSGSTLVFSGSRSHLNAALATLTYTSSTTGSKTIDAYIEGADGERYSTIDGRVFKVISTGGLNWSDAKAAAEASMYGGMHGYLASIMNADQANFITERIPSGGTWLGGNDIANEGDWRWSGGPEADTAFWNGDNTGSAVGGAYINWAGGMPDNYGGGENCLEAYSGTPITWNDQDCSQSRPNYVIEYGDGVTIPYVDNKQIIVTVTAAIDTTNKTTPSSNAKSTNKNNSTSGSDSTTVDTDTDRATDNNAHDTVRLTSNNKSPQKTNTDAKSKPTKHVYLFAGSGLLLLLLVLFLWHKKPTTQ